MNAPTVLPEVGRSRRVIQAAHHHRHMGRLRGMKDDTLRLDKTIALRSNPNVHVSSH